MPRPPDISDDAEAWLEEQSEHGADLVDIWEAYADRVASRYMEVLADPDERNEAIAAGIVGYLYTKSLEEFDDAELAAAYWAKVDEYLDLSWEELHAIPPVKRGDLWNTAREVIDLLAIRQARVDSGFTAAVMAKAQKHKAERLREWNKLSDTDRERLAKASGIKQRTEAKAKERKAAVDAV